MRNTAPERNRFMFRSNARGFAWKIASIQLRPWGESARAPAAAAAIRESVSPRLTRCVPASPPEAAGAGFSAEALPAAVAAGAVFAAAGSATAAGAGAAVAADCGAAGAGAVAPDSELRAIAPSLAPV